jgi:hypothetical protein
LVCADIAGVVIDVVPRVITAVKYSNIEEVLEGMAWLHLCPYFFVLGHLCLASTPHSLVSPS